MNIHTYRFNVRHAYNRWNYPGGVLPALTPAHLLQSLAGVGIRELTASPSGGYDVHIELKRDSHQDAVTEIESVLAQYAFYTPQTEVTEWATAVAEGALLGGSGGGAIGASTRTLEGLILGAGIGAIVGAIFGQAAQTIKARYLADRIMPGMWQFTQAPIPQRGFGPQPWGVQP
jgi:hypothetical protein